jgi:hypothetical protein
MLTLHIVALETGTGPTRAWPGMEFPDPSHGCGMGRLLKRIAECRPGAVALEHATEG